MRQMPCVDFKVRMECGCTHRQASGDDIPAKWEQQGGERQGGSGNSKEGHGGEHHGVLRGAKEGVPSSVRPR